ncbi:MAG: DUF1836 domain-containing protein [Lachnospiraceae bacterium]|nr:DUF1836 domain-containing protein [Lachnospiraceae bacterium]
MTINTDNLLESILESLDRVDYIRAEEIPNIDLYMDQVTSIMEERLRASARYPDSDKILTKTMINNYSKNDLLPPPVKKKYSREHILLLIFIYYFKGFLSMGDISRLLKPITEEYFHGDLHELSLQEVYEAVFSMEGDLVSDVKKDLKSSFERSQNIFESVQDDKEREHLQTFAFICTLSFDVYMKKMMIEKMIDAMPQMEAQTKKKHEKKQGETSA